MEKRESCRFALLDRSCLARAHACDYSVVCTSSLTYEIEVKEFKGESRLRQFVCKIKRLRELNVYLKIRTV